MGPGGAGDRHPVLYPPLLEGKPRTWSCPAILLKVKGGFTTVRIIYGWVNMRLPFLPYAGLAKRFIIRASLLSSFVQASPNL